MPTEPRRAGKLVAFTCERRGSLPLILSAPGCGARRLVDTAAPLAGQVLPPVPIRRWVLSERKTLVRFFLFWPDYFGVLPDRIRGLPGSGPGPVLCMDNLVLAHLSASKRCRQVPTRSANSSPIASSEGDGAT